VSTQEAAEHGKASKYVEKQASPALLLQVPFSSSNGLSLAVPNWCQLQGSHYGRQEAGALII